MAFLIDETEENLFYRVSISPGHHINNAEVQILYDEICSQPLKIPL